MTSQVTHEIHKRESCLVSFPIIDKKDNVRNLFKILSNANNKDEFQETTNRIYSQHRTLNVVDGKLRTPLGYLILKKKYEKVVWLIQFIRSHHQLLDGTLTFCLNGMNAHDEELSPGLRNAIFKECEVVDKKVDVLNLAALSVALRGNTQLNNLIINKLTKYEVPHLNFTFVLGAVLCGQPDYLASLFPNISDEKLLEFLFLKPINSRLQENELNIDPFGDFPESNTYFMAHRHGLTIDRADNLISIAMKSYSMGCVYLLLKEIEKRNLSEVLMQLNLWSQEIYFEIRLLLTNVSPPRVYCDFLDKVNFRSNSDSSSLSDGYSHVDFLSFDIINMENGPLELIKAIFADNLSLKTYEEGYNTAQVFLFFIDKFKYQKSIAQEFILSFIGLSQALPRDKRLVLLGQFFDLLPQSILVSLLNERKIDYQLYSTSRKVYAKACTRYGMNNRKLILERLSSLARKILKIKKKAKVITPKLTLSLTKTNPKLNYYRKEYKILLYEYFANLKNYFSVSIKEHGSIRKLLQHTYKGDVDYNHPSFYSTPLCLYHFKISIQNSRGKKKQLQYLCGFMANGMFIQENGGAIYKAPVEIRERIFDLTVLGTVFKGNKFEFVHRQYTEQKVIRHASNSFWNDWNVRYPEAYKDYEEIIYPNLRDFVLHLMGKNDVENVLEVCGGKGVLAKMIIDKSTKPLKYTLLDYNAVSISDAKKNLQNIPESSHASVILADILEDFPDTIAEASQDVVLGSGALTYIVIKDKSAGFKILNKLLFVLKPGGYILLSGHAESVLTKSDFESVGLSVLNTYLAGEEFQFYVLQKPKD